MFLNGGDATFLGFLQEISGSYEMAFGNADLYSTSLSLIIICVNYSFIDIKFDLEIYLLL